MRGRDAIAVALRHPDGRIVFGDRAPRLSSSSTATVAGPFARGLVVLYETLIVGTRWLIRSAGLQAEDEGVELGKGSVALMLGITAGRRDRHLLPAGGASIATFTVGNAEAGRVQHPVEGLIRVALCSATSRRSARTPDIRAVPVPRPPQHRTTP